MTAPVVTSYPTGAMAFLLPSALATAPSPTSDAVSLRSRPETTMAVAAYVGGWDEADARALPRSGGRRRGLLGKNLGPVSVTVLSTGDGDAFSTRRVAAPARRAVRRAPDAFSPRRVAAPARRPVRRAPGVDAPLPGDGAGGRLRFDDARLAFDGVPTADLVRALCVFQACGVGPLVAHGERLRRRRRVLGDAPSPPSSGRRRGAARAPPSVYDYAGEAACDAARDIFAGAIEAVARVAPEDGFAAIKVTALGQPELLERWSSGLVETARLFGGERLPTSDRGAFEAAWFGLFTESAASRAAAAETFNARGACSAGAAPAIDHICLELMRKYNRGGGAVVHNTYQCYLTATAAKLERHAALANREGWHFGAKLVRGAYLHLERARAARLGYADPVHATIEDTHACFDAAVAFALARPDVRSGRSAANVLVASHNRASVERALDVMANEGLDARTSKVYFGQLLGMADHHNGDLSSNVAGERALLVGELARRARAALGV
ncbi:proline dehydrogenase [Aureococcus anophagefferens]|nr:proline dehydrogenase [Aureococcus anophagefferens]